MTRNKRLTSILLSVPVLLLIPLIAMQFTKEVNWTLSDFVVMGALLAGTGLIGEFILRKVRNKNHRLMLCGVLLLLFFLTWAELAVGIFGTPFGGS